MTCLGGYRVESIADEMGKLQCAPKRGKGSSASRRGGWGGGEPKGRKEKWIKDICIINPDKSAAE